MNLLEISKLLLSGSQKRRNNIFYKIPVPWIFIDFITSKFPTILNLFEENIILQQFLFIRR